MHGWSFLKEAHVSSSTATQNLPGNRYNHIEDCDACATKFEAVCMTTNIAEAKQGPKESSKETNAFIAEEAVPSWRSDGKAHEIDEVDNTAGPNPWTEIDGLKELDGAASASCHRAQLVSDAEYWKQVRALQCTFKCVNLDKIQQLVVSRTTYTLVFSDVTCI